jgi:hypothetical protein
MNHFALRSLTKWGLASKPRLTLIASANAGMLMPQTLYPIVNK